MSPKSTKPQRQKKSSGLLQGGKVWFAAAAVFATLAAAVIFLVISNLTATTTYYVLNQDVSARDQITADMLTAVTTSEGGQPRNALDIGYVQSTYAAAKYSLSAGDIVTASNIGALSPITEGVPGDYVVASFAAPAQNAVAGKVERGDYIDLISTYTGPDASIVSKYVLRHVLVLDVSADLTSEAVTAPVADTGAVDAEGNPVTAAESNATRAGIPALYTVALPPTDATVLALIADNPLLVVLSAADFEDQADISSNESQIFGSGLVGNSGANTDPTFGDSGSDEVTTENGTDTTTGSTSSPSASSSSSESADTPAP